jgi:predicted RNase H-like HicB family nuclease
LRYAVVLEKAEENSSAYAPDLPGCVAVGDTLEEVKQNIKEAIAYHLAALQADGLAIPKPTTKCDYVEVAAKVR